MRTLYQFWRTSALVFALLFCAVTLYAQTNQGELAGNVLDTTGAAVPNADITATNEATGSVYHTTSTSAGSYRFPSIQLGKYTITANAQGFKQSVTNGLEIHVGNVTAFDIRMAVGGAAETVTVNAEANTIQTQSSDVGGVVTTKQVLELPLALGGVGALRSP